MRGLGDVTQDSPKFKNYFSLVETMEKIIPPIIEMKDHDDKEATPVFRALIKDILAIPCGKGWNQNLKKEARLLKIQENDDDSMNDDEEDENAAEKIRKSLIQIATTVITNLDFVQNECLDVLFYHIINPQRSNFAEARALAEDIIRSCSDNESDTLANSIRSTMTAAAKEGKLPEEFELTGSSNRSKFFEVLRYLHYVSFDLVSGAIQELKFWLQSENEQYRKEAVTVVGMLTRDKHCQFGMDSNDPTWSAFLNASIDQDDSVRHEFVQQSKDILISNHSHLRGQIINSLLRLSVDLNDDIRRDVVTGVTEVAKTKLEVISDKMLKACAERMKDKKPKVRIQAIKRLMDLYNHVMTSSPQPFFSKDGSCAPKDSKEATLSYTESEKESVRFISTAVFNVYRLTQRLPAYHDARAIIERYFQLYLVPYKVEPKLRVRLMADLFRNLDDIGCMLFGDIINRSSQLRRAMIGILSQVGQFTEMTTQSSAQLKERIRRICQIFPDAQILEKNMMVFVNQMAENDETFNLVKKLMSESYTSEENARTAGALQAIMEKKISSKAQQTVFRHFIDRIVPLSFDVPTAKEIIHLVSDTVCAKVDLKKWAENCFEKDLSLLKIFTDNFGYLFADEQIIEEIRSKILASEEPIAIEAALHVLSKIFANSHFRNKLENEATHKEKWFLLLGKDLKDLVMREEPELRRSCKLATRLLSFILGKEKVIEFFDDQIEQLISRLYIESQGAANAFQVLGEIFRCDISYYLPQVMDVVESEKIGPMILTSSMHGNDDPVEFNELMHIEKQPWPKYAMAKVYAAKFATKVLTVYPLIPSTEDKRRMEKAAQNFIDLLSEIIEKKGDLGGKQCDLEQARLRATASGCLLKLASVITYRTKLNTHIFKNMSYIITDEAYCVRLYYALHVKKGLSKNRLPIEFAACYGLVNLGLSEEDGENKMDGFKTICMNQAQQAFGERNDNQATLLKLEGPQRAIFCSESVIAYVVWLLANYDKLEKVEGNANRNDSSEELEIKVANVNLLSELQESLWLVIDSLKIAKCNMQKVWKVLEKLKTCGDKSMRSDSSLSTTRLREHNEKLWVLCDLGITMMLYRAKLQMEDQEAKEAGFNLQFFYVCSPKDKADPSNVYAPDVLINDEKNRNGRIPKPGRVFHVSDLTSEFTPPPQGNESTGSNSSKNASRRANVTGTGRKRGGAGTKTTKRKSGGSKISDDEGDSMDVKSPAVKKTRSKRGEYDLPDEEDEEMEVIPLPKRRGAAPDSTIASSSSNGSILKNGSGPSPKKRNSRGSVKGRQNSTKEAEIDVDSDEEMEEITEKRDNVSLDNLIISPILDESSGRTRRSARTIAATATITSSTPLVPTKPKITKRKRSEAVVEEVEDEEPEINDKKSPSPKKRVSGRRSAPTPTKNSKKAPVSPKKKTLIKETNGVSPKKNKYGLPMEEDDDSIGKTPKPTARTSRRLSKK